MSTAAQVLANQTNAQHSTGPVTPEGKERVSQNRLTHGLAGEFRLLPWESQDQFDQFAADMKSENAPQTPQEERLVHAMIQHQWIMQRALTLQEMLLFTDRLNDEGQKKFSLYLRYQTTNERSYYKALKELQYLRKQKRAEEIGFESQKQKAAEAEAKARLATARAAALEIETEVHKTVEAPLPGNVRIEFADIQDACAAAIRSLAEETLRCNAPAAAPTNLP